MGKILPKYHVELLKEDGTFAQPGEEGEIILVADGGRRPEGLMMGYLDDEEANPPPVGWRLLPHRGPGHPGTRMAFCFTGAGFDGSSRPRVPVSPVEIEDVLSLHPAVYECLAVGEPDPDLGQRVKVYVMLAPGYAPSQALEDELMAFHNNACAGFKKIRALEFVDALAHNANGKLIRGQFRPKN